MFSVYEYVLFVLLLLLLSVLACLRVWVCSLRVVSFFYVCGLCFDVVGLFSEYVLVCLPVLFGCVSVCLPYIYGLM